MRPALPPALPRLLLALLLTLVTLVAAPLSTSAAPIPTGAQVTVPTSAVPAAQAPVVEHLRLKVPAAARAAWLEAERRTWEPWLRGRAGFLGRELLWDPEREEGILLIRWASREQWQAIPQTEVERVQRRFERVARAALGNRQGNPFPLTHSGELHPLATTTAIR